MRIESQAGAPPASGAEGDKNQNGKAGESDESGARNIFIGAYGGVMGGTVIPKIGNVTARFFLAPRSIEEAGSGIAQAEAVGSRTGPAQWLSRTWMNNFDGPGRIADRLAPMKLGEVRQELHSFERTILEPILEPILRERGLTATRGLEAMAGLQPAEQRNILGKMVAALNPQEIAEYSALTKKASIHTAEAAFMETKAAELGTLWRSGRTGILGSAVRGAAIAGAGMLVDHYLDRAMTGHDHHFGLSATTALSIPFAVGVGVKNPLLGVGVAVAGTIAGRYAGQALENVIPTKEYQSFSAALRPNSLDALSMGVAIGLPANNSRTKLALATGGWVLGRMDNTTGVEAALWGIGGTSAAMAMAPNPEMRAIIAGIGALGYIGTRFTEKPKQP